MALEDYVPVVLTGLGMWELVKITRAAHAEIASWLLPAGGLVVLGGLTKATWKLIIASTGQDIGWLDDLLFVFLAPGFILLASLILAFSRQRRGRTVDLKRHQIAALGLISLTGIGALLASQGGGRAWVFVLLGATTLANVTWSVLLIMESFSIERRSAGLLFLANIVLVFVLSGLARLDQSVALQWIEQGVNTLSSAAFLGGALLLGKGFEQLEKTEN
jgi:hypothetical protein